MNVMNIHDKKEFNEDGTYNGAYGDMVQVPKSLYNFMLSSSQQILPAVNKHVIAQNFNKAKQNASDPKAYRYYMNQAALYKRYSVNNPDMDQRIRQSLTDPDLQRIEGNIKRLRTSPVLKTDEGMKHYQNLQIERERRFKVLEDSEHEKFRQFINNPSNNITPGPESMSDTPYHSRVVKSFLASHPDMIQNDVTGNLYVMGKKISDDPKQAGRIMHFITHDYSDLSKTPQGTSAVLNAMRNKGFNIKDIGNTYLREHLQKRLTERRQQRRDGAAAAVTTPPARPGSAVLTPRTPSTPASARLQELQQMHSSASARIQQLQQRISKQLTPQRATPPTPQKADQETPKRKRARTEYSLRARRVAKKIYEDLPKKKAKRKHKKQ